MIIRLTLLALLMLAVGAGVYVLDRPPGSAYLLPPSWSLHASGSTFFGAIGDSLPSLVHAFSFSILSALALPRTVGWTALACGGWGLLDTLLEVGQHPHAAPLLAKLIGDRFQQIPVLDHLTEYFTHGVFDPMDVGFGLCGAGLAFIVVHRVADPSRRTSRSAHSEPGATDYFSRGLL